MPVPAGPTIPSFSAGPCEPWELADCRTWPESTLGIRAEAIMAATEVLWEKTYKRFGLCEYTLRPCAQDCAGVDALAWLYGSWLPTWGMTGGGYGWPYPALVGGLWLNLGCGTCQNTCSCTEIQQVALPYPVSEILEVKVDGVVLDPSDYRMDDWRYLVRLDGGVWPRCNNLNLADTQDGTWSVTAIYGEDVPELGKFAANDLALQIALACVGDGSCILPSPTVKRIQRQGVSKEFYGADLSKGLTGIYSVDLFISTYAPTRSGVATILDLDRAPARRVGT